MDFKKDYYVKYDTVNDANIKTRLKRHHLTRKFIKNVFGSTKSACLKYVNKPGVTPHRQVIGEDGKPIFYIAIKRLGSHDSLDGEAYKLCKPSKRMDRDTNGELYPYCVFKKTFFLAIKVVPLTVEEASNKYNNKYRTWKEIDMLRKISRLVVGYMSPNLPIYYTNLICNDSAVTDYQNENIIRYFNNQAHFEDVQKKITEIGEIRKKIAGIKSFKEPKKQLQELYHAHLKPFSQAIDTNKFYSKKSVLIFNEISSYDVTHLLDKNQWFVLRKEYILPTIFQILHGLATIQQELGIVHFDLHTSNVLVTRVNPAIGVWWYRVDGQDYYIPNQGYIFKIWDFGRSIYLKTDNKTEIKNKIVRQFNRFFRFDQKQFRTKLNQTFKKEAFRKYLYAFDVYRFFSAYQSRLMESISEQSKSQKKVTSTYINMGTSTSAGSSKPLNKMTPRQINQLPEIGIMKKIIDHAIEDILFHMVSPRIKNHKYRGIPINLIKEYFDDFKTRPPDTEILNPDRAFEI